MRSSIGFLASALGMIVTGTVGDLSSINAGDMYSLSLLALVCPRAWSHPSLLSRMATTSASAATLAELAFPSAQFWLITWRSARRWPIRNG